jgi:hypothetical protein
MKRWLMLISGTLIATSLCWWVWQVTLLKASERSEASGYGQFVLAAIGLLIIVAGPVRVAFRAPSARSLDEQADLLAGAMRNQWENEALNRRIYPEPLVIRWSNSSRPVGGPLPRRSQAGNTIDRFDPLPGVSRMDAPNLRNGNQNDLHAIYASAPSGRLLILGPGGSGKTSAAILLLLAALRHRAGTADRASKIPVPVMFTLHGWDPNSVSVDQWLVGKLTEIPMFSGRKGGSLAAEMLRDGRIAVFLDGLDEVAQNLRGKAIQAISGQAGFRLVLLARTDELADAAKHHHLVGAIALEIQPVKPLDAADYLLRQLTSPPPERWGNVVDFLRQNHSGPMPEALTSPLVVTLIRDAYQLDGPVDELLDTTRFSRAEDIRDHLLDHLVTAAYTRRIGLPAPAFTENEARRYLSHLASSLDQQKTHDLLWWEMSDWDRTRRRTVATSLGVAILVGSWVSFWTTAPTLGFLVGLVMGARTYVASKIYKVPRRIGNPFADRHLASLAIGGALTLGLITGYYLASRSFDTGVAVLAGFGVAVSTAAACAFGQTGVADTSPNDPITTWHKDLATSWLLRAPAFALAIGIILYSVLKDGAPLTQARFGGAGLALAGIFSGIALGIPSTATWWLFVAQLTFPASKRRLPLRVIYFLEDARSRNILRTAGAAYQFRHSTLQRHLTR